MRFFLITASLLFATHSAFAADTAALEDQVVKIQTAIDNANSNITNAESGKKAIQVQIDALRKKLGDAKCDISGFCYAGSPMSSAEAIAVGKSIQNWNDQIDQVDNAVKLINGSTQTMLRSKDQVSKAANDPNNLRARIRSLETTNDGMNKKMGIVYEGVVVNTRLSNLKWSESDKKSQLDVIVKEMDNSKVGLYFQDKMGALLNSHLFCDAVSRHCLSPDKSPVDREGLKEIFPDITSSNSRSGAEQRARTFDKNKTSDTH